MRPWPGAPGEAPGGSERAEQRSAEQLSTHDSGQFRGGRKPAGSRLLQRARDARGSLAGHTGRSARSTAPAPLPRARHGVEPGIEDVWTLRGRRVSRRARREETAVLRGEGEVRAIGDADGRQGRDPAREGTLAGWGIKPRHPGGDQPPHPRF